VPRARGRLRAQRPAAARGGARARRRAGAPRARGELNKTPTGSLDYF
jgi:hypothetical protein